MSPPRAPAYANSEVASYYVQYARGPLWPWFFFFGAFLFVLALLSLVIWFDPASAILCTLLGALLVALGALVQIARSTRDNPR